MAVAAARTLTETVEVEPTLNVKLTQPSRKQPQQPMPMNPRRLRLDPLRALEPTRKKISTIEAQRVMSVFEDNIKRVEVITLLPYIMNNIDKFKGVLGYELMQMLEKHKVIVQSYTEIREAIKRKMAKMKSKQSKKQRVSSSRTNSQSSEEGEGRPDMADERPLSASENYPSSRPSSSASSVASKTVELEVDSMSRQLTLVAAQLSHSCKNILRMFHMNPNAMNAILERVDLRTDESKVIVGCLKTLRDILLGKLLTTPEEEKERMAYLEEVSQRERQNATIITKVEAELQSAIADKDEEIRRKNDVIRRLQADLHQIERLSEEHIRRVKAEAEKQEAADIKNSEGKRQKLQQELNQLKTQLQNLIQEHHDSEQELRRKKFKVETEVENWIQRYDQDMGERQDEYEEIDTIYTEEKKQLHELEERFATLEEEYLGIMEERRLARERREAAEREMAMLIKCATTIQAFWRSYKVRKALKSKKKKGGKKKR